MRLPSTPPRTIQRCLESERWWWIWSIPMQLKLWHRPKRWFKFKMPVLGRKFQKNRVWRCVSVRYRNCRVYLLQMNNFSNCPTSAGKVQPYDGSVHKQGAFANFFKVWVIKTNVYLDLSGRKWLALPPWHLTGNDFYVYPSVRCYALLSWKFIHAKQAVSFGKLRLLIPRLVNRGTI